MPLAEAEIEDQMKAAQKEWRETVQNTRGIDSDAQLPAGVSRHDFTKWKEQQAVAARRRLSQLEERLQRLQLLRNKLHEMKSNALDTVQQSSDTLGPSSATMVHTVKWNLPGETEKSQPGPPALLSKMNAAGGAQWSTLQDVGDDDPDSPIRNEGGDDERSLTFQTRQAASLLPSAHLPPPFTPGLSGLRQIIRDEMNTVVTQAVKEGITHSKTVAWDVDNEETEQFALHGGKTGSHAHMSPPPTGGRPRTTTARQAWTAQTHESEFPPDFDVGGEQDEKLKGTALPLRIEDAEMRSVPLLFGGLSRQSPLRMKCFSIMHSKLWGSFFFTVTLLSCISSALVVELGIAQDPTYQNVEYIFNAIFLLEILIGVLALGLINGPTSWLRISGMNVSFFIVRACWRACAFRHRKKS